MTDKALKTNACWDNLGEHTVDDDRFVLSCSFESELSAAQQENQRLRETYAADCVAMIEFIPSFGRLNDAIKELGSRLAATPTTARQEIIEECAKVCDQRAEIMNRLGSDAKMKKTLSHAEIQAERVWEAKHIAAAIRALNPKEEHHKGGTG